MRTPKQKDSTPNGLIPIDLTLASLPPQQIKALLRLLLVEVDVERKLHRGEVEDTNLRQLGPKFQLDSNF